jgi:hypothetical protein
MPGLVAPGGKCGWGTSGGKVFHAMAGGASSLANGTNLGNLAPGHAGVRSRADQRSSWRISGSSEFRVSLAPSCSPEVNRLAIPSRSNASALRDRVRLSDIDFFGSLPCGLVEQDEGADLFVQLLRHRVSRQLLHARPLFGTRSALSRAVQASPLVFPKQRCVFQAYRIPHRFARIRSMLSQLGYPTFASLELPSTSTMLRDSLLG